MAKSNSTKALDRIAANQLNPMISHSNRGLTLENVSRVLREAAYVMATAKELDIGTLFDIEAMALINEVAAAALDFELVCPDQKKADIHAVA